MLAFEAFRKRHEHRPDFTAWQKSARPLAALASLENILKLSSVAAFPRAADLVPPAVAPRSDDPPDRPVPEVAAPEATANATPLVLGRTASVSQAAVTFGRNEFMQHAAFLGGTGSGKTTAALNVIEQLLALDVPASSWTAKATCADTPTQPRGTVRLTTRLVRRRGRRCEGSSTWPCLRPVSRMAGRLLCPLFPRV